MGAPQVDHRLLDLERSVLKRTALANIYRKTEAKKACPAQLWANDVASVAREFVRPPPAEILRNSNAIARNDQTPLDS